LIANESAHTSVRTAITYRFLPRLSAGLVYYPRGEKVSVVANWLAISETRRSPALILGTSPDRIGTPSGQSFYANVSKSLKRETRLPIAPYVGVAYGTYDKRFRPIGGLNIGLTQRFTSLVIFDGVHVHPTLNFSTGRHGASFILVRAKNPGLSYSISF